MNIAVYVEVCGLLDGSMNFWACWCLVLVVITDGCWQVEYACLKGVVMVVAV